LALYDRVGSIDKTSEALGIPHSTIQGWVADPKNYSLLRTQKSQELAQKFDNAANLFLDLAVKKSKDAQFNHLMTAAGIAVDKSQLLRGQPTQINETIDRQELAVILQTSLAACLDAEIEPGSE
jgi:uncharacterized membrane protein YcjF (UPF0283 family)